MAFVLIVIEILARGPLDSKEPLTANTILIKFQTRCRSYTLLREIDIRLQFGLVTAILGDAGGLS